MLGTILAVVAFYWGGGLVAEHYVRKQLDAAAAGVCAEIDPDHAPDVSVTLLSRSLSITGLTLLPSSGCSGVPVNFQGRIDTLHVSGISLIGMLFGRRASARSLRLYMEDARITLVPDSLGDISNAQVKNEQNAWTVEIGSFDVRFLSVSVVTQAGDTISALGNGIEANGNDLLFMLGKEQPRTLLSGENTHLSADSVAASMANGYNWSVGNCVFDQERGTLELLGMNIGPKLGLEAHSATLPHETDVIEARLDTLRIEGLDLNTLFAERIVSMRSVRLGSGAVTVLRDKLLPDGQDPVKPLPSRSIRALPLGWGADTIVVSDLDVEYRERVDGLRGYGVVPFAQIQATITGARHNAIDTSAVVVRAHALAFDSTGVSILLRSVIADSTDRFELEAGIAALPFRSLNKATGPLVDIQATDGYIDTLIYRMSADDSRATGMVHMVYHGLKVASGGKKSDETMNRIESALLNSLLRNSDRNKNGDARDGRFTIDRRRDRRVFNYLWSGLREGVKAELLPEVLTK